MGMRFICGFLLLSGGLLPFARTNPAGGMAPAGGATHRSCTSPGDSLSVMFWNVENFFDWRDDGTTDSDAEFSSRGERHWTWKRFQAKANAFAKALLWTGSQTGRLPDIVGLAEVENAFVLRQVLQKTALRKLDYRYVHFDSPDRRGIDVALLYRTSRLELLDSRPCHLFDADSLLPTRDILLCRFRLRQDGLSFEGVSADPSAGFPGLPADLSSSLSTDTTRENSVPAILGSARTEPLSLPERPLPASASANIEFAVLVNHHPSKYGGASVSEPRRRIAVERLRFLADSLRTVGIDRIIAAGDFNDTPDNPVFRLLEPSLLPLYADLHRRGEGTIKYEGKWDLIDHFYVSPELLGPPGAGMRILRIPFLLVRDTAHAGEKPLRTYVGPRYAGGVSDHLPILLEWALPP